MAKQCRPHAFAYAGEGKRCQLSLCPLCNALEAALTYERVRRALHCHEEVGLVLGQFSLKVKLDDLDDMIGTVAETNVLLRDEFIADVATSGGHLGSIVKLSGWPHETFDKYAVLSVRVLVAVPAKAARQITTANRQDRGHHRRRRCTRCDGRPCRWPGRSPTCAATRRPCSPHRPSESPTC